MPENRFQRKKAQTKEKIYSAALVLFMEKGYDQTTVQEIVDKADVAKGTFFAHFPAKDDILAYLGEQRVMVMEDMLTNTLGQETSAKEKFVRLLTVLGEMNEKNRATTELLSRQILRRLLSEGMEKEKTNQVKLKELFIKIFKEGQQNGEFRPNLNLEQAADSLISIYFFTLIQWLEKPRLSLTEELLDRFGILRQGIDLS
jgi:TetR/AcrR family transcriptional regulator, cholesterol catabolism regulator